MSMLSAPYFHDENAARAYLEAMRWPDGPVCPHCSTVNNAYVIKGKGKYRCATPGCRGDFTVTIGTVLGNTRIPLHKSLFMIYFLFSSKRGSNANQLMHLLGVHYVTCRHTVRRLRDAMETGFFVPTEWVALDRPTKAAKPKSAKTRAPKKALAAPSKE